MANESFLTHAIADTAIPMEGGPSDFDVLLERIGNARFVLLGEATHGTHDFYRIRAELTKRLICEKGFTAIAAEADWPDAYRVNRYVRGTGSDTDAADALDDFHRFPQWMWRNADIVDLVGWLRSHNDHTEAKVGFYGLDVYSLHASMRQVIGYLETRDPPAAQRARERYACFDNFGGDPQMYGHTTALQLGHDCEQEVIAQLVEIQRKRANTDEHFAAEQNARVVARAEEYYRSMYLGSVSTWNLRDTHMMDTLDSLAHHLGADSKIVVWAHNSHVGDAEATVRIERGEINIGHLCRRRYPRQTYLLGFSTYHGSVTAASDWEEPCERKRVRPALRDSYEALFHDVGLPRFILPLHPLGEAVGALHEPRLQRAIGVVYRPQTERLSHYYHVRLPEQLDAIIHIDQTRALEPLERTPVWEAGELPETYPTGL